MDPFAEVKKQFEERNPATARKFETLWRDFNKDNPAQTRLGQDEFEYMKSVALVFFVEGTGVTP